MAARARRACGHAEAVVDVAAVLSGHRLCPWGPVVQATCGRVGKGPPRAALRAIGDGLFLVVRSKGGPPYAREFGV